jgi:primosomal protein N' (replication factor Y)
MDEGDFSATHMIGPAPCFYARQAGLYRWQIVLRGPNPLQILLRHPLGSDDHPRSGAGSWRVEVDPINLL